MNERYDVSEGLAQVGKAGIGADTLAVPEPSAVKVAWAVLWGGGGSNAVSLPARNLSELLLNHVSKTGPKRLKGPDQKVRSRLLPSP